MSQRRKRKALSATPEVDYVVNSLEVLGRAWSRMLTAIVKGLGSGVCCILAYVHSSDRKH